MHCGAVLNGHSLDTQVRATQVQVGQLKGNAEEKKKIIIITCKMSPNYNVLKHEKVPYIYQNMYQIEKQAF